MTDHSDESAIRKAAAALVAKLDAIHEDPRYQAVWIIAKVRNGSYEGPQYRDELEALRSLLTIARKP